MTDLLLTEVIRSYYRGVCLDDTAALRQQLVELKLLSVLVVVRAFDHAGFIFTKKGFGDEGLKEITSIATTVEIDFANKIVQMADRYRLFFTQYCDRSRIKDRKRSIFND